MNTEQQALLDVINAFKRPEVSSLEAALNVIFNHADLIRQLQEENDELRRGIVIQRDENGAWPDAVIDTVGLILEPHPAWYDPDHFKASLMMLRDATAQKLDALASSQREKD